MNIRIALEIGSATAGLALPASDSAVGPLLIVAEESRLELIAELKAKIPNVECHERKRVSVLASHPYWLVQG